ncbi:hypothetical protein ACPJHQ_14980 [Rossellomorea sp. H39__3]
MAIRPFYVETLSGKQVNQMEEMFVTTSGRADESVKLRAKTLAEEFQIPYIERKKRSIANYMNLHQADCLVLGKERDELHRRGEQPFFFHPNSASFRIKRVLRENPIRSLKRQD